MRPLRLRSLLGLTALAAALPAPARAGGGLGDRPKTGKSLYALAGEADAVVTGKIEGVGTLYSVPGEFTKRAPRVTVASALKGPIQPGEIVTFIYRADLARGYKPGDDVLVFLRKTAGDAMFQGIQTARWVSWYDPSERAKIALTPENRQAVTDAVARYVAVVGNPSEAARSAALRAASVGNLASPSRLVARDAADDLAAEPGLRDALAPAEVAALQKLAAGKAADPYVRAAAIRLLAGRPDAAGTLGALLQSAPEDRLRILLLDAVAERRIRSAAPQAAALLSAPDPAVRDAAARALGALADERSLDALCAVAERDPVSGVRASAVRAIGAVGGSAGRAKLEAYAREHPDPRVRALAARRLGGGA